MEASTDKNGELLDCKVNKKENQFKIFGTNGDLTLDKKSHQQHTGNLTN